MAANTVKISSPRMSSLVSSTDAVEGAEVATVGVQVVFDDGEEFAGVAAQPGQVEHDEGVAAAHVIEGGGLRPGRVVPLTPDALSR